MPLLLFYFFNFSFFQTRLDQPPTANIQDVTFGSIPDPIANPLMGWAPSATNLRSSQAHSLVYAYLTWHDFEPLPGVFDFTSFEAEQNFSKWRADNVRVVFRFVMDMPGSTAHRDIPDWLYSAIGGDGEPYNNSYGMGFSPNYANSLLIQYHQKALQALGNRYGQDDFVAFVEMGSLGHWGEWHTNYNAGLRRMPLANIRDQYVSHYVGAFPHTPILMRRPFAVASQLGLGVYNDMAGDLSATNIWLDWIANGGTYYETGEKNAIVPMPDAWKTAPMGGEQTESISSQAFYATNLSQTVQLLRASHTTFLGPGSPWSQPVGGALQAGIDTVLQNMGYRIRIQNVRMPLLNHVGSTTQVSMTFANDGVAPMYASWPVKVYIFDGSGQPQTTIAPVMDVQKILPGAPYEISFLLPTAGLKSGLYKLGFAIIDPHTTHPGVRLAMNNPRQDLIQELITFKMSDIGNFSYIFLPFLR